MFIFSSIFDLLMNLHINSIINLQLFINKILVSEILLERNDLFQFIIQLYSITLEMSYELILKKL